MSPGGPGKAGAIVDLILQGAGAIAQVDLLAIVAQSTAPRADCGDAVDREQRSRILGDDEVTVGRDGRSRRESELDRIGQGPARQIEASRSRIIELNELLGACLVGWIVVDFVDHDLRGEGIGSGEGFCRTGPGGAGTIHSACGVEVGGVGKESRNKSAVVSVLATNHKRAVPVARRCAAIAGAVVKGDCGSLKASIGHFTAQCRTDCSEAADGVVFDRRRENHRRGERSSEWSP